MRKHQQHRPRRSDRPKIALNTRGGGQDIHFLDGEPSVARLGECPIELSAPPAALCKCAKRLEGIEL